MKIKKNKKKDGLMFFLKRKLSEVIIIYSIILAILIAVGVFIYYNGEQSKPNLYEEKSQKGFTFFNLSADTTLSNKLRDNLSDKLGYGSEEDHTTMDLGINYRDFLEKYFPELAELNKKLNPAKIRIEHNTIKLTYRHTKKKNTPFDSAEIIFSKYTKKPLVIEIKSKKQVLSIIDTIKTKHGQPDIIKWDGERGRSLYWKETDDVMIMSIISDKLGNSKYQIMIFYVNNIKKLIHTEEQEKTKQEKVKKKAVESVF
ncbi:hypothetical protein GMMP1_1090011 [Candidatus Magnetomoraceae bacterium gMMP-1]